MDPTLPGGSPHDPGREAFFRQLGHRIAEFRKARPSPRCSSPRRYVTQQTVASCEVGRRRVPVAMLPTLARALRVSVEALIDEKATPGKRGPAPQIQQKIERLTRLPKAQQKLVLEMLDGVLAQAAR